MSQSKIQKGTEKNWNQIFYLSIHCYINIVILIFFQWMFDTGITFGEDLNSRVQEDLLKLSPR